MIVYEGVGNLFSCGMHTIICSVNTVGAMGKGIALTFKKHVPGLYTYYQSIYHDEPPNYPSIHRLEMFHVDQERSVLLLPTKDHWRFPSKRGMIDDNLRQLAERYEELGIRSLGLPAIGCGFETGRLSWERDVRPLVYRHLDPLPIPVKIFVNRLKPPPSKGGGFMHLDSTLFHIYTTLMKLQTPHSNGRRNGQRPHSD